MLEADHGTSVIHPHFDQDAGMIAAQHTPLRIVRHLNIGVTNKCLAAGDEVHLYVVPATNLLLCEQSQETSTSAEGAQYGRSRNEVMVILLHCLSYLPC